MATKTIKELLDATSYEDFDTDDINNLIALKEERAANVALMEQSIRGAADDAAAYQTNTAQRASQYANEFEQIRAISPALINTEASGHLIATTVTRRTYPIT